MKNALRRMGAILLCVAMMATMLPIFSMTASAAGTLSVSDSNIGLSWTDASNSSGSASWSASGTTITGTATGYKMMSILSRTITTKLTIKNNYSDTRTLSFTYSLSGGGSVSGISGNSHNAELAAGASLTITLTSPSGPSTCTLTISNIQLIGSSNVTTTFLPVEGGSYTVDGAAISAETSYEKEPTASSYTVKATPASGYSFFGWYDELGGAYMSYDASATLLIASDAKVKPVFVSGTPAHFQVGTKRYYDLSDAVTAAQNGSDKTIVVVQNGTVSGTHTIPSGITLLVPYNSTYTSHGKNASCTSYDDLLGGKGHVAWVEPTKFRELTLAADAHITVNGAIEVSGQHASAIGGNPNYGRFGGSPTGPLGFINMQAGSHIDLNNGSNLYCWGYIYGDGTITAKSGAAVYENFQLQDFRGGDKSTELAQGFLVFPNSQYYVQNVEVATRYEYGAIEYVHTSVYMSRMEHGATVQFIGSDAMFQPQPGSYVVKDYDPTTDNLILESYGDCALSELAMSIAGVDVDAAQFVLPIANNMQIHIKSGTATLKQNVMLLPGSSITVDQGATLNIAYTDYTTDVVTAGGYILQMFDYDNYTWGIDMDTFEVVADRYYNYYDRNVGMRIRPVDFTCTERYTRTEADLKDAMLNVNGTIISNGYIYSTVTYADVLNEDYTITGGGANITSSEGTGVIEMVNGCGYDVFGVMYDQGASTDGIFYYIPIASAQLNNGDGTMLDTTDAEPGTVYFFCEEHGGWKANACLDCDPCGLGHDYVGAETKAPTCEGEGETTYTCSNCGDSYTEAISALGHDYVGTETQAPTCEGEGETTYTCSNCGDSYTESIDALGHTWDDATCTVPKTCSVCGATEGEALGHTAGAAADCVNNQTCTVCGEVLATALGHTWDDATCTAPKTCSVCGATEGEALGHTPGAAADCVNDQTCIVCGEVLATALGHTWDDATCTAPKTCSVCGATEGDALGHTAGAAADCENAQVCTVCGAELAAALGHTWNDATCTAPKTCSVCGATEGDALGHTAGAAADCENAQVCTVCGEVLATALGHDWNDATCTAPKTCSVCGATEGDALGHTAGAAADCENAQVCTVCGAELATALGHTWDDATCTAPKTCSVCGATEGDTLDHIYDNDFDAVCNVCGAVRVVNSPISFIGKSISEDVSGLAMLFNAEVEGIVVKAGTFVQADYTNATYNGYKLLGLGVKASNGVSEINIEGLRMYDLEEGNAKFAFRIINIPADKLDVEITMTPYYTVEVDGVEIIVYGEAQVGSYAEVNG